MNNSGPVQPRMREARDITLRRRFKLRITVNWVIIGLPASCAIPGVAFHSVCLISHGLFLFLSVTSSIKMNVLILDGSIFLPVGVLIYLLLLHMGKIGFSFLVYSHNSTLLYCLLLIMLIYPPAYLSVCLFV